MIRLFALIVVLIFAVSAAGPVLASKRVALVIGNSAYEHATPLLNPKNDAESISAVLEELGFDVVKGVNLRHVDFAQTVNEFRKKLRRADVGLFFYAGHGLQVHGKNYLAPIDAELESEVSLGFEAVPLHLILKLMESEAKINLVFLDACRDNPLARNLARSMGTRSTVIGRGLAREETGLGTFIAFATQPGNVALDGEGENSPFATGMLKHIKTPGLDVDLVMRRVREDVIKVTKGSQVPWTNSSLTGTFVFNDKVEEKAPSPPVAAKAAPKGLDPLAIELAFWQAAKDTGTRESYQAYLLKYPKGNFAPLVAIHIEEIEQAEAAEVKRKADLEAARKKQEEAERAKRAAEAKRKAELAAARRKQAAAEEAKRAAEAERQAAAIKKATEEAARRKAEAEQREKELAALQQKQAEERARLANERDKLAARLKVLEEQAKAKAEAEQEKAKEVQVASLQPATMDPELDARTMTMVLQNELKRVGCDPGKVDGKWGRIGARALTNFNKHASLKLSTSAPSMEAIEAIKGKTTRVCPLTCGPRFNKVGDQCVKKTCKAGQTLNRSGKCVKPAEKKKTVAKKNTACPSNALSASSEVWSEGSIPTNEVVVRKHPCGRTLRCVGGIGGLGGFGRTCRWQ